GLLPAPEGAAEVAVKADGEPQFLGRLDDPEGQFPAVGGQGGGDSGQVEPVEPFQQFLYIESGEVIFGDGAVLPVVGDLAGPDSVAGFQVVGAQPVGGSLLGGGQDHGGAVYIVGAQHAHGALTQ